MIGGKWMDNLMDRLAQRWNAQEIIKANTAAEAEEVNKLRAQVKEYQESLEQMRGVCNDLKEVSASMEQRLRENASGLEKILKERIENLSEETAAHLTECSKELAEQVERLEWIRQDQDTMKRLQHSMEDLSAQVEDVIHTENVKLYRNVQAVVTDENKKQAEGIQESVRSAVGKLNGKLSAVLGISVVALLAAIAGILLQVFQVI